MLEILFLLLMLGLVVSTTVVGLRERKARLAAAKSRASSRPIDQDAPLDAGEPLDAFGSEAGEQFELNPDEFKK